jgi:hypothetical protein
MWSGARGVNTPTCYHMKTRAATSSHPNPKTQATREVLAHSCVAFHPCTCGLRGGVAVIAVVRLAMMTLGCCRDNHEEETIVIN